MVEQEPELLNRIAPGTIQNRRANFLRTLFVHIGTHKTGTTSIQNFLRNHATSLNDCGIFVPKTGTVNESSGHHNIAWEMRKDRRYDPRMGTVNELITELKACAQNTAVISSEDFEYLVQYPNELKAFDESLEGTGFSTKYIVYFRERDSYARSLFCELESAQLVNSFDEFRRSVDKLGFVRVDGDLYYEFRYDLFVKNWENILGPKVSAYSYDQAVKGTGVLPSFLLTIGASEQLIRESQIAPVANTMFDKFQLVANQLMAMSTRAQQAEHQFAAMSARAYQAELQLQLAEHQLAAVKNSKSWRITAPLRSVVSFLQQRLTGGL